MSLVPQLQSTPQTLFELQVIQFNCNHANHKSERAFFEALNPKIHHIIAVQEPHINTSNHSTFCPVGYTPILLNQEQTRVAIFVSKEIEPSSWLALPPTPNLSCIILTTKDTTLAIINAYNPGRQEDQTTRVSVLPETELLLRRLDSQEDPPVEILLLGDFNLHHASWGGPNAPADLESVTLLNLVDRFGLRCITPQGATTFSRGQGEDLVTSTIDLAFASPTVTQQLYKYQLLEDESSGHDHVPILISFDLRPLDPKPIQQFKMKKIDKHAFLSTVATLLQDAKLLPQDISINEEGQMLIPDDFTVRWLNSKLDMERRTEQIQGALLSALGKHCPRAKPSYRARRGWSRRAQELVSKRRRARREAARSGDQEDYQKVKELRNQIKAQLCEDATKSWWDFLTEVSKKRLKTGDLWKISKWSRNQAGKPPAAPHLPPLQKTVNHQPTTDFHEKSSILAAKFFPPPAAADLSDLEEVNPLNYQEKFQLTKQSLL